MSTPFSADLSRILTDLWGESPAQMQQSPKPQPAPKPVKAEETPYEKRRKLYQLADQPIDWTGIMTGDLRVLSLYAEDVRDVLSAHAAQMLEGDTHAYMAMVRYVNPLGELGEYIGGSEIRCPDADHADVSFDMLAGYSSESDGDIRLLLSSLALRSARDIMALLPVSTVSVHGQLIGRADIQVTFNRDALRRVSYRFIDPEQFVKDCGAVIGGKR